MYLAVPKQHAGTTNMGGESLSPWPCGSAFPLGHLLCQGGPRMQRRAAATRGHWKDADFGAMLPAAPSPAPPRALFTEQKVPLPHYFKNQSLASWSSKPCQNRNPPMSLPGSDLFHPGIFSFHPKCWHLTQASWIRSFSESLGVLLSCSSTGLRGSILVSVSWMLEMGPLAEWKGIHKSKRILLLQDLGVFCHGCKAATCLASLNVFQAGNA